MILIPLCRRMITLGDYSPEAISDPTIVSGQLKLDSKLQDDSHHTLLVHTNHRPLQTAASFPPTPTQILAVPRSSHSYPHNPNSWM